MKSNKGITLVALVITIIVLLILAGVSISLVVGDNGIMTRAKDAGTKTNEADALESFKLSVASLTTEYTAKVYGGEKLDEDEDTLVEYVYKHITTDLQASDCTISDFKKDAGNQHCTVTKGKGTVTIYYTVSTENDSITNITTVAPTTTPTPEPEPGTD